jgi:hypothetical protein
MTLARRQRVAVALVLNPQVSQFLVALAREHKVVPSGPASFCCCDGAGRR